MSSSGGMKKRKHSSSSAGSSGSRAQSRKLATKAAKRSKSAAAQLDAGEERTVSSGLMFDSDEEETPKRATNSMLIRGPRRAARGDGDDEDEDDEGDDDGDAAEGDDAGEQIDPFADESPDEKRVRLARAYLASVEQDVDVAARAERGDGDDEDEDEPTELEQEDERAGVTTSREAAISHRLKSDLLSQRGILKQVVAHARYDSSSFPADQTDRYWRYRAAHKAGAGGGGGATCITMDEDNTHIYTGGKDTNVVGWDVETGKKIYTIFGNRGGNSKINGNGHTEAILSVSLSSDGNFLATASADESVKIWDPRAGHSCVRTFPSAHRGAVTSVCFRLGSHSLFTGAEDRTIKIWNIDQLAYVETLYGHTSEITGLDALYKDRCISSSRDKTMRLWKVVEETQLKFNASIYSESIDCISMVNEEQFLSGGQDGTVCAWMNTKKKPTSVIQNAHSGKWIQCVAAQKFTDVCFSGSSDGFLNLYCLESQGQQTNKLNLLHKIPLPGYINGLVSDRQRGRFVAAAVGQEERAGRWHEKLKQARNGWHLISLAGVENMKNIAQEQKEARMEKEEMNGAERMADEEDEEGGGGEDDDDDAVAAAAARKSAAQSAAEDAAEKQQQQDLHRGINGGEEKKKQFQRVRAVGQAPAGRGGYQLGGGRGGRGGGGRGGGSSRGGGRGGSSRGGSSRGGSSRGGRGGGGRGGRS